MTLTSPPTTVAPFESGRLAAGISASATTITVGAITKTVNGVRTKQGFDTTSGIAIISQGGFTERISFEGSSVDATTKVTTLTTCVRGLSATSTTASFSGGTGRIWPKGAKITLVADVSYFQSAAFKNVANTFSALQTFSAGVTLSGTTATLKLPELTTTQRDALTATEGMLIKNSTTGTIQSYTGGAWASVGTDATANGSTTVAGKYEEGTVAEQGSATATGATGARLVPAVANLVKTSSGAGDENKIAILGSSGTLAVGFLGTGSPSSSNFLRGDGAFSSLGIVGTPIFGDGSDGAKTIASSEDLNPAGEFEYTTLTLNASQTLSVTSVNTPLTIKATGNVTINGTINLAGKGGAGGASGGAGLSGVAGTAGLSFLSGFSGTNAGGGGVNGQTTDGDGGGGGGGSSLLTVGTVGVAGTTATAGAGGSAGAVPSASLQYSILTQLLRSAVCGAGGGGGGGGFTSSTGRAGAVGGAGGGAMVMLIGGNLTLGAASVITVAGVAGTAGSDVGNVGGGGGGGGGFALILVGGSITNSGTTLTVAGGAGGNGLTGGGAGGAGGDGKIIIYSLSTGTIITA